MTPPLLTPNPMAALLSRLNRSRGKTRGAFGKRRSNGVAGWKRAKR